jgi:hypothetical protein
LFKLYMHMHRTGTTREVRRRRRSGQLRRNRNGMACGSLQRSSQ